MVSRTMAPMTLPMFDLERPEPTKDDYYTPAWIFEALGLEFDLDAAAPPGGVPWIPARRFFTQADDGLAQPWEGRVWCNPPFSRVREWSAKFSEHGDGIFLGPFSAARWPAALIVKADLVWIPDDNLRFARHDGEEAAVQFLSFMAAFGDECAAALARVPRGVLLSVMK